MGKHLVVDNRIFQLLVIRNSYSYSDKFRSKQCSLNWTKLDGAQSDAFLTADVICADFLDFYLFVVTNQT